MTDQQPETGAYGWPRVPSTNFPGELTLACPKCGAVNWTMGTQYARFGTGSRGQGRLGDPGSTDYIKCNACGHQDMQGSKQL